MNKLLLYLSILMRPVDRATRQRQLRALRHFSAFCFLLFLCGCIAPHIDVFPQRDSAAPPVPGLLTKLTIDGGQSKFEPPTQMPTTIRSMTVSWNGDASVVGLTNLVSGFSCETSEVGAYNGVTFFVPDDSDVSLWRGFAR